MRVYLGSDHAGFALKQQLASDLAAAGYEVVDTGPAIYDAQDDYPAYCLATGAAVVANPGSLGVVIGGSGNGEQIAANKISGVRAALACTVELARLAREHNDANVMGIGARQHAHHEATEIVMAFLSTPFSQDPRHVRRIEQIAAYERTGQLPPV